MPQCVVVESDFVYSLLENGCGVCDEIVFRSYAKGHPVRFTPTTGHELVDIALVDNDAFTQGLLPGLRNSPLGLVTLDPVANDPEKIRVNTGLAHLAALNIQERGAIGALPINLAYILAETAVVNTEAAIYCLALSDEVVGEINQRLLQEIWVARGLAKYYILSRTDLLKRLQRQVE
jgi:hypothetical protein